MKILYEKRLNLCWPLRHAYVFHESHQINLRMSRSRVMDKIVLRAFRGVRGPKEDSSIDMGRSPASEGRNVSNLIGPLMLLNPLFRQSKARYNISSLNIEIS